jgi:hypothetical protein|mmetsp:Transcript_6403/g.20199  ORF Transcript_6403/g.20199 Transcript_6403/m.20199 type:complete len:143 (-) Transcript_6403:489-917(-)
MMDFCFRFRALANLALDEASQTGLAASDAMVWCVRGLYKCSYVHVLRAAAHATAAIAYRCRSNKARFAQLGALAACVRVVNDFGTGSLEHTELYSSAVHVTSRSVQILWTLVSLINIGGIFSGMHFAILQSQSSVIRRLSRG